jgi:xanthine dehydrogenase YagR molybdenum-binding subunit
MNEIVGKPIDRVDGRLKVTGTATYSAEYYPKNMAYGVIVESAVTKGRVKNIDTSIAGKLPGVINIMTCKNSMNLHFPQGSDPGGGKYAEKDLLPLQNERRFYGGQCIAVVIAETFEQAEHASTLLKIEYEKDKPVYDLKKNLENAYKPALGLGGSEVQMTRGNTDAALQSAMVKLKKLIPHPYIITTRWSRMPRLPNGMVRNC